jgi:hypothetical protein
MIISFYASFYARGRFEPNASPQNFRLQAYKDAGAEVNGCIAPVGKTAAHAPTSGSILSQW